MKQRHVSIGEGFAFFRYYSLTACYKNGSLNGCEICLENWKVRSNMEAFAADVLNVR